VIDMSVNKTEIYHPVSYSMHFTTVYQIPSFPHIHNKNFSISRCSAAMNVKHFPFADAISKPKHKKWFS